MTKMSIPSFRGRRALVIHQDDRDRRLLQAQLGRLGMIVECSNAADPLPWSLVDVCFFDADADKRQSFPWTAGEPDIPLIAMIGTETPERIQWSFTHGVCAFLVKPLRSSGTYLALMQADYHFRLHARRCEEISDMREKVKSRRVVFKVLLRIMKQCSLNEDQAFERLRDSSMQQNISIEELAVNLLCGQLSAGWDALTPGTVPPDLDSRPTNSTPNLS